jgi:hypothetical protein
LPVEAHVVKRQRVVGVSMVKPGGSGAVAERTVAWPRSLSMSVS